jgi:hypothetical protein
MNYFVDTALVVTPSKPTGGGPLTTSFFLTESKPGAIDFVPVKGTKAEPKILRGIYRHQGNILTFCYDTSGTGRPQTFDDDKESENIIILPRESPVSIPEYKPSTGKPPTTTTHPPTGSAQPEQS